MINKISEGHLNLNFGRKFTAKADKNATQEERRVDILSDLDVVSKAAAAQTLAAQAINEAKEDELFEQIRIAATEIINDVNALYENGNIIREDGSSVKIIDTSDGKESMYENSADIITTRKSYFKDGKLYEIRIPIKNNGRPQREIIIKTYKDGKTLEDYELKSGKHGEGTIDALITYAKDGSVVAYMGKAERIQAESALYINL